MTLKKNESWQPLYVGDPKWRGIFLMPPNALRVWLYHYSRENRSRESYPSIATICTDCDLNESTVLKSRKWLVENGWLAQTGVVQSSHGHFHVPKYRAERGTVPEKITTDRNEKITTDRTEKTMPVRPRKDQGRTVPKKSGADAPTKIRTEPSSSLTSDSLNQSVSVVSVVPVASLPSEVSSVASLPPSECEGEAAQAAEQELIDDARKVNEKWDKWVKDWLKASWDPIADALGVPYVTDQHHKALDLIANHAVFLDWTPEYVADMYRWTQSSKFWSKRVLSLDHFAKFIERVDERGMAAKYARYRATKEGKK